MKNLLLSISLLTISLIASAQDDLKVMQYNLLNYGNITSYCTTANNNMVDKEVFLRTIINYIQPDIFTVNEIASIDFVHNRVLDSVMNHSGQKTYLKANKINTNGSDLVNMLYYNSAKLIYVSAESVQNVTRDIVLYRLYYNSPNLSQTHDTAWVNCIVGHLKAGSGSAEQATRASMTDNAMTYLVQHNLQGNYLFMGDFNIQRNTETSYQNLVNFSNPLYRFYDPINRSGTWNNSSSFADIHTQSTHASSNGCASSGGMDDRFDFILASNDIMQGNAHVNYVSGSYKALGNDGNHFNQSVNSGTNTSAPANIIDALYNMSDHLPVIMELHFDSQVATVEESMDKLLRFNYQNPIGDVLNLNIESEIMEDLDIEIWSLNGQVVLQKHLSQGTNSQTSISLFNLASGMYILRVNSSLGQNYHTAKIIKY